MHHQHTRCIRKLDAAIKELREAQHLLSKENFEQAENEIGDSLVDISKALRCLTSRGGEKDQWDE
ncbi:hypothetical protein [Alicyclobacillus fodiniaquatilis]|uniref:Spo0E like sporulation regulatory protein n=1 Tax=Alicyclobacillus fodiniaquatilis TaxID=1661150 RepID=A0ABW4JQF4_9BACL